MRRVTAAREAQKAWRDVPIAERAAKVCAFLDALLAMNQEVVPEIAQQMGRPVRYGGEFRGVEERARYMIAHRRGEPAADPGRRREAGLPPHDQARAGRPRARHRALELSLSHRHQHHRAGADGRQCGAAEARVADGAGRRALPDGDGPGRPAEGPVPEPRISATTRRAAFSAPASSIIATSPAPSPAGAPSSAQRPAPSRRSGSSSAARTRPMCAPTPISTTPSRTSSTAPSSIPASAAAASSASTCTRSIYDRFVEGAVDLVNTYVLGNPLDEATTLGPMAHKRFADLVRQQNAEAVAKGAKAHIDAEAFRGRYRRHGLSRAAGADRVSTIP